MARKTIPIAELKRSVNALLLHSPDHSVGQRLGAASILESVLHKTGNYNGFGYLNRKDMEESLNGATVGINTGPSWPFSSLPHDERFAGTDKSRVVYF